MRGHKLLLSGPTVHSLYCDLKFKLKCLVNKVFERKSIKEFSLWF